MRSRIEDGVARWGRLTFGLCKTPAVDLATSEHPCNLEDSLSDFSRWVGCSRFTKNWGSLLGVACDMSLEGNPIYKPRVNNPVSERGVLIIKAASMSLILIYIIEYNISSCPSLARHVCIYDVQGKLQIEESKHYKISVTMLLQYFCCMLYQPLRVT